MKLYIFITTPINIAGGSQCYLAAKAKQLESNGWKVVVFSPNRKKGGRLKCLIKSLDKYLDGNIIELLLPPFKYPSIIVSKVLRKMEYVVGNISYYDEKIIESHEDIYSQWGELFAKRINARHYFFTMNESYRGANTYYEDKMDFYNFKFNRREIEGCLSSFKRLFDGYRNIMPNDVHGELILDECPIQDYCCKKVDEINKRDWNICYIGRADKSYVSNILRDVGIFSSLYPDKKIQFIIVGNMGIHRKELNEILSKNINLSICELGYLHPIPTSLYKKTDVVIAGSGSARHSCEEGAVVIVADTETKLADGVLGYETLNSVYKSDDSVCSDFVDALRRVLVEEIHLHLPYRYPPKIGVAEMTEGHFELFAMSERKLEYYDEEKLLEGRKDYWAVFRIYANKYFPKVTYGFYLLVKVLRGHLMEQPRNS